MNPNEMLYSTRLSRGLTRHTVSRECHLFPGILGLYEDGYLRIGKKDAAVLALFYGLDPSALSDPFAYPTPLFPSNKKTDLLSLIASRLLQGWVWLLTGVLALASIGFVLGGIGLYNHTQNEAASFYPSDLIGLVDFAQKNGESDLLGDKHYVYAPDSERSLTLVVPEGATLYRESKFTVSLTEGESTYSTTYCGNSLPLSVPFTIEKEGETAFRGNAVIDQEELLLQTLEDADGEAISDQAVLTSESKTIAPLFGKASTLYSEWQGKLALNLSLSFHALLTGQEEGTIAYLNSLDLANGFLLIPAFLGVVFVFAFALLSWGLWRKKKKEEPLLVLEAAAPEEALPLRSIPLKPKTLPKNWLLFPFLPESILRFASIAIVLASSILLFRLLYPVLSTLDLFAALDLIGDAQTWYQFMPLVTAATLLWFFIRLEIIPSEHYNILPSLLMLFFGGCLYYVFENLLTFYFGESGNPYYGLLFTLFTSLLPGNLFWCIDCFTLIALFLLTSPAKIKPQNLKWWRLASLLPMAYLVFSYFYDVGTALWGWSEWPSYLSTLLYRKQFITMAFSIFYPLGVYLYRLIAKGIYGKDNISDYVHSRPYFWFKNFIAAGLIAVLVLLNHFGGSATMKALGFSVRNETIVWLIPLVLFYHPHLGKRNSLFDLGVTALYIVGMSFTYLYAGYYLLYAIPSLFGLL